jgi:hypothetical protein
MMLASVPVFYVMGVVHLISFVNKRYRSPVTGLVWPREFQEV